VIRALDAIHHVDVRGWPPHDGVFDDNGVGLSTSWRNYLLAIREEEEDWNFYASRSLPMMSGFAATSAILAWMHCASSLKATGPMRTSGRANASLTCFSKVLDSME